MKNTINISLTLFTVFLILFQGCKSFSSTSFSKNEISKVETFIAKKLTITSRLNNDLSLSSSLSGDKKDKKKDKKKKKKDKKKDKDSKKDDDDEDAVNRKSTPTFVNKGFKCMSYRPVSTLSPQYCANADQKCISKGLVMMGPLKSGDYAVLVALPGNNIKCDLANFDSKEDNAGKRCFTHEARDPDEAEHDKDNEVDDFSHRACIKNDKSLAVVVKQGKKSKCNKATFKTDKGKCKCYKVSFPFDDSLTSFYYPVRFNTDGVFECISGNKKSCTGLTKEDACLAVLSAKIDNDNIIKTDVELDSTLFSFFFNRWICPEETGLKTAVKFESGDNGKTYNVNCLSLTGEDCLYDENAQAYCTKVNSCEKDLKEAKALQCGSPEYKKMWFNNGFNTPLKTFCKAAAAWLRFDSFVEVTKTVQKIGLVLLPNGMTACIPAIMRPNECLIESDQGILRKTIEFYMADQTQFANLIKCQGDILKRAANNPTHWCSNSLQVPDDNGQFKSKLDFNLYVAAGKKSKNGGMETAQEKFTKAQNWQEYFAFVSTEKWSNRTKTYPNKFLEDVNGDGIKDIIGFAQDGVYVSLGTKDHGFEKATLWNKTYNFKEYNDEYPKFVVDMNKDGKADLVIFAQNCTEIAFSDGEKFGETVCAFKDLSYDQGWRRKKHYRYVTDINNDGYPDLAGFGGSAVFVVFNELGKFKTLTKVSSLFGANRFNINQPRYFEDINGDGCKDIVSFKNNQVSVVLATDKCSKWESRYNSKGLVNNWNQQKDEIYFADINDDGKIDLVARKNTKMYFMINKDGKKFENSKGINLNAYKVRWYNFFLIRDLNGDGYPDIFTINKNGALTVGINNKRNNFDSPEVWDKDYDHGYYKHTGGAVFLSDLNKNELPDLIAIGNRGVDVALNSGSKFETKKYQTGSFTAGLGNKSSFDEDKNKRFFTDVNGDGLPDAVAYTDNGIIVNINNKTEFQGDTRYSQKEMSKGWDNSEPRYVIDLNKDGKADIIGFDSKKMQVMFNNNDIFTNLKSYNMFSGKQGWKEDKHFRQVVDLNKDGAPDIIGCGNSDVFVSLNDGKGGFGDGKTWVDGSDAFSLKNYNKDKHPRFVVDVNGDGYADLIGFHEKAVMVALNDNGKSFKSPEKWSDDFTISSGWTTDNHPRFLIDMNNDKLLDIVGFGDDGVFVALNKDGKSFDKAEQWTEEFGKKSGWMGATSERLVVDINKDGLSDVVAFGKNGVSVALGTGRKFEESKEWSDYYGSSSDAGDWKKQDVRDCIDMNGDGFPDIVGIKDNNIEVAVNMLK